MANSLTVDVIEDGPRNAVVNLVGIVDSGDITSVAAIPLNLFSGTGPGAFLGLRVVDIDYSVTNDLVLLLKWNGNTPQIIGAFSQSDQLRGRKHGGLTPDLSAGGYDGSINVYTKGFVAGNTYGFTARIRMTKIVKQ